jgi:hypothetical protein
LATQQADVAGIDLEPVGAGLDWQTTRNFRLRAELHAKMVTIAEPLFPKKVALITPQ